MHACYNNRVYFQGEFLIMEKGTYRIFCRHKIDNAISQTAEYSTYAIQSGLFLLLFFTGWFIENLVSRGVGKRKWTHAFFNVKFFIVDAL